MNELLHGFFIQIIKIIVLIIFTCLKNHKGRIYIQHSCIKMMLIIRYITFNFLSYHPYKVEVMYKK